MSGRRTNSTRPAARVGAGLAAAALVSLALPVTTGTAAPATPSAASAATGRSAVPAETTATVPLPVISPGCAPQVKSRAVES